MSDRRGRGSGKREAGSANAPARLLAALLLLCSACSWFTDFKQQPKIDPWETPADTIAFRGNPQNLGADLRQRGAGIHLRSRADAAEHHGDGRRFRIRCRPIRVR